MKKLIALALALMLICSMAVPAHATSWYWFWKPGKTVETAKTVKAPEPSTPTISNARYYHSNLTRLQIEWTPVENADSYVVLIIKANGEITTYTTTETMLYLTSAECPKVYIEDTRTWAAATVRVMAVTGTNVSNWSAGVKIGCDMLH